ncbi:MAG: hypothetical protein IKJ27_06865, partial [Clostridia bacterium]|nr:hypothetical protein [Clostridia bacterium]
MPRLKGNSPVRGNVCKVDKRVPVSGGKGVRRTERFFFFTFMFYKKQLALRSSRGGSYFVLSDKVCKTLFGARSPKVLSVPLK